MAVIVRGPGRPQGYHLHDGTRVPSVTTITGNRKSGIEGLLVWANKLGQEGKSHRDERQKAADAGTYAHTMVENAIHGRDPMEGLAIEDAKQREQAMTGFVAWQEWSKVMDVRYIWTETPLVSESHRFGGTPDALAVLNGQLVVLDWKTSNGVYPDYICQLAAYRALVNESKGKRSSVRVPASKPVEVAYLLRFGKDHADYHVHAYNKAVLAMGWEAFLHMRRMYDLDAQLKKVAS